MANKDNTYVSANIFDTCTVYTGRHMYHVGILTCLKISQIQEELRNFIAFKYFYCKHQRTCPQKIFLPLEISYLHRLINLYLHCGKNSERVLF
jgi:hypothetical protein